MEVGEKDTVCRAAAVREVRICGRETDPVFTAEQGRVGTNGQASLGKESQECSTDFAFDWRVPQRSEHAQFRSLISFHLDKWFGNFYWEKSLCC